MSTQYGHAHPVTAFDLTVDDIRDLRLTRDYVTRNVASGLMRVEVAVDQQLEDALADLWDAEPAEVPC